MADAKEKKRNKEETRRKLLDEKLEELSLARRHHSEAVAEWEEAHAHAAQLKKSAELAQLSVNAICADLDAIRSGNYTPNLPFPSSDPQLAKDPIEDGPWRLVPMAEIVNGKMLALLEEAGILTAGEFRARVDAGEKIKGIGPGNQAKICDALAEHWKLHPELLETPVQDATTPAVDAIGEDSLPAPECPSCSKVDKVIALENGQFTCDKCNVIFDRLPDEGGTHFNDPTRRIEKEEAEVKKKKRA